MDKYREALKEAQAATLSLVAIADAKGLTADAKALEEKSRGFLDLIEEILRDCYGEEI